MGEGGKLESCPVRFVCSNHAATQTNTLKTQEKSDAENIQICRHFANFRNLLQSVMLL